MAFAGRGRRRWMAAGMGGAGLAWGDMQVLSTNSPAIALYRRSGFQQTGEIADMFRIDGLSFGYTNMSKRIA
ncbi:hypothetical protein GJ699_30455 [Duganella sp. FT80W]|uniref:GNAT family N-acetyltransferase n=1 Tax=Duganella guangzhouensis TaxID=2666084 RepID=A0A6I2LC17_9BURK|nr:hypothetical protein [Duganella guangzhouensis]MRW94306.1 hypothetical protein [Duganella guangzhouensis]